MTRPRIIDTDGQEYEVGEMFAVIPQGAHFLGSSGRIQYAFVREVEGFRHILTPIRKRHVFGNGIFEETGEKPRQLNGEFGMLKGDLGRITYFEGASAGHYIPLKLVGLVEEQDD